MDDTGYPISHDQLIRGREQGVYLACELGEEKSEMEGLMCKDIVKIVVV